MEQRKEFIQKDWAKYAEHTKNYRARKLIQRFLEHLEREGQLKSDMWVTDIGCGSGGDTAFYASKGFNVVALDFSLSMIEGVKKRMQSYPRVQIKISDIILEPIPSCDIASASYCLPFIPPESFVEIWHDHIKDRIRPGGYFVGHFLGNEDGWASENKGIMTFFSKKEVETLFPKSGFEQIELKEKKKKSLCANGQVKYWHIFTAIFRKKHEIVREITHKEYEWKKEFKMDI